MKLLLDTHAFIWWDSEPDKDPFDRIIVAQAKCERLSLLTHDAMISNYPVSGEW